jgi:hypothetical protein
MRKVLRSGQETMTVDTNHALDVGLELKWVHGNSYDAEVSVVTPDSGYVAGELKVGLPPAMAATPEVEYLTFAFTHRSGPSSDLVKTNRRTIRITFSPAKPKVSAFAVVNGKVAGQDSKTYPKRS